MNILNIVEKHLLEENNKKLNGYRKDEATGEWVFKPRSSHHPSAYNKCRRQMYYQWTNEVVTDPPDGTGLLIMLMGTWIHDGFAKILKDIYGDDVENEVEFTYKDDELEFPIHGYFDDLIMGDDDLLHGVELKTAFGRAITNVKNSGKPRDDDEAQIKVYLSCNPEVSDFKLPYLGRDSMYRTEFNITMTEEEREIYKAKVVAKFKDIEESVKNKAIPNRDYTAVVKDGEVHAKIVHKTVTYKSDWQCSYCNYKSKCWEVECSDFGIHLPKEKTIHLPEEKTELECEV